MSSYVAIANRAAIAVGTTARLNAPSDDTVLGRAVAAVWELERKAAIRAANWNFAMRRATLPALLEKPKHGYDAQFQLPAKCLKLVEVSGSERLRFQKEGDKVLADTAGPLDIRYLEDIAEPAQFDAGFAEAFALRIAMSIGNRIAGSAFDKQGVFQMYSDALSAAERADALENPPIEQEESDWVTARTAGTSDRTFANWVDGG